MPVIDLSTLYTCFWSFDDALLVENDKGTIQKSKRKANDKSEKQHLVAINNIHDDNKFALVRAVVDQCHAANFHETTVNTPT